MVGSDIHAWRVYSRWRFMQRHLYHSRRQLRAMRRRARRIIIIVPIFAILTRSRPRSSTMEVSRSLQKERRFVSGTGRMEASKDMFAKVSLMSCFKSSKGVSILDERFVRGKSRMRGGKVHTQLQLCLSDRQRSVGCC